MSENTLLNPLNILKGPIEKGVQLYTIMAEDKEGNLYAISYGCLANYADGIEKSFSRLFPIDVLGRKEES